MAQRLGFQAFTAKTLVQSLVQGTEIPQAARYGRKKKMQ